MFYESPIRRQPFDQEDDCAVMDPNEALRHDFRDDIIHRSEDDHFNLFSTESDGINVRNRKSVAGNDNVDRHYDYNEHKLESLKARQCLTWNKLNAALFAGLALLSAATTVPITLIPTMSLSLAAPSGEEWSYAPYYQILEVYDRSGMRKRWIPFRINQTNEQNISSSSIFASHLTSVVTLVTAFGKFINGAIVDIAGARRLLLLYGMCTCLALLGLRHSTTPTQAIMSCAAVDFFSSVNWSSAIVILGAHYGSGNERGGSFERGLYVTSLACRCGSLLTIPLSSLLMKWTSLTWRGIAGLGSGSAFCGVLVFFVYLTDSPGNVHDPHNPLRTTPPPRRFPYHPSFNSWTATEPSFAQRAINFCTSVTHTVLPSIRAVLISRVFWVVAAAHAGAMMVKQSERILGTYFRDTSYGVVTESKASAMTVFLSLGMLTGLFVGGKAFATAAESERLHSFTHPLELNRQEKLSLSDPAQIGTKNMVAFLYCFSICMCYMLSFLAVPFVRRALHLPVLVLILQVLATLGLGFGVAVQYYHIPAIVSATYGKNRGLYTAYTEGIAGLLSSIVWRIVGGAVEEGNPQGGGWAYGWAAVALLLVFCGTLMIMILEIFFVGGGWHHTKENDEITQPAELPTEVLSSSWMDDDLLMKASPLRKPKCLNTLSNSALQFIESSPAKIQSKRRESLLLSIDSRDEEDTASHAFDRLGIDDDGSLLPPTESGKDVREPSVFDNPYDRQYNNTGSCNSFEL